MDFLQLMIDSQNLNTSHESNGLDHPNKGKTMKLFTIMSAFGGSWTEGNWIVHLVQLGRRFILIHVLICTTVLYKIGNLSPFLQLKQKAHSMASSTAY